MNEKDERLAPRGPQGERGEQGEQGRQGTAGLSRPVRRALVFMFALAVLLGGLSLYWTAHEVHASQTAIQAAQVRDEAAQRREGALVLEKLCTTLGKLSGLVPPPGPPALNPSRAYEQSLHGTLVELGTDIGCKAP